MKQSNKATLKKIAHALRVQQIDVLDWAVSALQDYYEYHGKRLLLPLRFSETFSVRIMKTDPESEELVLPLPPTRKESGSADARKSSRPTPLEAVQDRA